VATSSRLLKITGLFCKRDQLKRRYSAKETYNFTEPTNCSHPIQDLNVFMFVKEHPTYPQKGRTYPQKSVAVCCGMLQYVAVCCSMLQFISTKEPHVSAKECCSMFWYVAVCCSMLQYVAVHIYKRAARIRKRVLQYVVVCCSVLHYVAVCCSSYLQKSCTYPQKSPTHPHKRLTRPYYFRLQDLNIFVKFKM